MHPQVKALGQRFTGFMEARFQDQWRTLREEREPELVRCLLGVVDPCLRALRARLAQGGRGALPEWLDQDCPPLVGPRLTQAKTLLLKMVVEEAEETGRIVTINGLAMPLPRLALDQRGTAAWADRLAGGQALEESIRKSLAEFGQRAAAAFIQATQQGQAPEQALAGLDKAAGWWRVRLRTIAVTVLHGVFTRTQRAVLDSLG